MEEDCAGKDMVVDFAEEHEKREVDGDVDVDMDF